MADAATACGRAWRVGWAKRSVGPPSGGPGIGGPGLAARGWPPHNLAYPAALSAWRRVAWSAHGVAPLASGRSGRLVTHGHMGLRVARCLPRAVSTKGVKPRWSNPWKPVEPSLWVGWLCTHGRKDHHEVIWYPPYSGFVSAQINRMCYHAKRETGMIMIKFPECRGLSGRCKVPQVLGWRGSAAWRFVCNAPTVTG